MCAAACHEVMLKPEVILKPEVCPVLNELDWASSSMQP